jgi:hypothetical protein
VSEPKVGGIFSKVGDDEEEKKFAGSGRTLNALLLHGLG